MAANALRYACIAGFAWLNLPGLAIAEDHEAGVPLTPAEAAGAWTLVEAGQERVCVLTLGADKAGDAGFVARAPASCHRALPDGAAGWTPTSDGMALIGPDGRVVIAFDRWSNSLFVSHRNGLLDLELRRGAD